MEALVLSTLVDGVATLVLNRPAKANALDAALVEALHGALDAALAETPRLLVLHGAGRHFCAGFDFGDFEAVPEAELAWRFVRIEQLLQKLAHAPCATLALAHGGCYGAGADLFVACSRRVAASDIKLRMPGWRFGLALGTRRLVRRIGADAAVQMLETAATLDADRLRAVGLFDTVAGMDGWEALVADLAEAQALAPDARARLAAIALDDTRAIDMAALVESLTAGDLKARIRAFRTAP